MLDRCIKSHVDYWVVVKARGLRPKVELALNGCHDALGLG